MHSLQQAFYDLKEQLLSLYDDREAAAIAHEFIEHITGLSKLQRISDKGRLLTEAQEKNYTDGKTRLLAGEPLQYVTGVQWFFGQPFHVSKDVLIPRPETEELLEWIISDHKSRAVASILDIGTGSGCIPITLKLHFPDANTTAIDISEEALAVARRNAESLAASVNFSHINFLDQESWATLGTYDIIVSNPPYIPVTDKETLARNVRDYEPGAALFVPSDDALLFYRHIAEFGQTHLSDSGAIYCELNAEKGDSTKDLFLKYGYRNVEVRKDMHGNDRMLKATMSV
jgi:release factor glutamine methyltransferase